MQEQEKEAVGEVRVLTRAERNEYNGVTIEAGGMDPEDDGGDEQFSENYVRHDRPRTYRVYTGGFGWPSESRAAWLQRGSWQNLLIKAVLVAGFVGLAVFFVGIVLPVLFVAAGLAVAGGLIWKFLR